MTVTEAVDKPQVNGAIKPSGLQAFRADLTKQSDGVWVDFGGGVRVRLRAKQSKTYREAHAEAMRPHADKILRGTMRPEEAAKIFRRLTAEVVVVDWEGVGVPYSQETAYKIFTDPEYERFYVSVDNEADNFGNFKATAEAIEKGELGN